MTTASRVTARVLQRVPERKALRCLGGELFYYCSVIAQRPCAAGPAWTPGRTPAPVALSVKMLSSCTSQRRRIFAALLLYR